MDILKTFLNLTDYTYIIGDEHELKDRLPKDVKEDSIGNYFLKIGESETMFCSHLDTAAHKKEKVVHDIFKSKAGDTGVGTDGSTLLGADDKAGVVLMLNMIEHKIPGLYYFFIGEETGLVGSKGALKNYSDVFSNYKRCISFDRRDYGSVITKQMGRVCCSSEFAEGLIKELSKGGMVYKQDPTGIYTDSAVFTSVIPECTNLSVGYFNEHSVREVQNITYLEELAAALLVVDWEKLPTVRETIMLDTPKPKRNKKRPSDLTDNELEELFLDVDNLIEYYFDMYCFNFNTFEPEKEMIYLYHDDETSKMSVYIHENGKITIGDDEFENLDDLDYKLKYYYSQDDEDDPIVDFYTEINKKPPYWGNDDEDFNNKDDEKINGQDEVKSFETNLNLNDFLYDIISFSYDKNKNYLTVKEIDRLLEKRNKTIESFIIWVYYTGWGDYNKYGLKWDSEKNILLIDDSD